MPGRDQRLPHLGWLRVPAPRLPCGRPQCVPHRPTTCTSLHWPPAGNPCSPWEKADPVPFRQVPGHRWEDGQHVLCAWQAGRRGAFGCPTANLPLPSGVDLPPGQLCAVTRQRVLLKRNVVNVPYTGPLSEQRTQAGALGGNGVPLPCGGCCRCRGSASGLPWAMFCVGLWTAQQGLATCCPGLPSICPAPPVPPSALSWGAGPGAVWGHPTCWLCPCPMEVPAALSAGKRDSSIVFKTLPLEGMFCRCQQSFQNGF